jgi:GGDEF domain-containing protein
MQLCLVSVSRAKGDGMMMLASWIRKHNEEDEAVEKLREIIGDTVRQTDIVSRVDITQFALILTDAETGNTETVASRIRELWEKTKFSQEYQVVFEAQDILDETSRELVRIS